MEAPADLARLGDPSGMEALASELQLRAQSIAGVLESLDRQVEAMTFLGPAGDRLRAEMQERRKEAERVATDLLGAAHALRRGAVSVREQVHELQIARLRAEREGRG